MFGAYSDYPEDNDVVERLYTEKGEEMIRYAMHFVKNQDTAIDIVHHCMCALIDRYDRYRTFLFSQLTAYFSVMVRNHCYHVIKENKRMLPIEDIESSGEEEASFCKIFQDCEKEILRASIKKLPQKYRDYIYMKVYQKLTPEDIAYALGVSLGSLRMIQSRAIKQLAEIYQREEKYWRTSDE